MRNRITKIILKKAVRFLPWDEILYGKKEYFNSMTLWVYFSINDKLYKSATSLRLSKYVIYFA